ncbi:MAG: hypothetical protein AAF787_11010 [Chloroflexota bacterium]
MANDRIQLQHPTKTAPTIRTATYNAYRDAILTAIPRVEQGITFKDLLTTVEQIDPTLSDHGSVNWYVTTVKLHLEATGEIERIPGATPQRIRHA